MGDPSSRACGREALRQRVGLAILEVIRASEEMRTEAARQQQLHPTDFSCIAYLAAQLAPISPKQIIARLGLTSGSGTALLDRLEHANYIRRLPNPEDRRGLLVELNREAAAKPIAGYEQTEATYREVTDEFSDEELNVVARFLERLCDRSAAATSPGDHSPAAQEQG